MTKEEDKKRMDQKRKARKRREEKAKKDKDVIDPVLSFIKEKIEGLVKDELKNLPNTLTSKQLIIKLCGSNLDSDDRYSKILKMYRKAMYKEKKKYSEHFSKDVLDAICKKFLIRIKKYSGKKIDIVAPPAKEGRTYISISRKHVREIFKNLKIKIL